MLNPWFYVIYTKREIWCKNTKFFLPRDGDIKLNPKVTLLIIFAHSDQTLLISFIVFQQFSLRNLHFLATFFTYYI